MTNIGKDNRSRNLIHSTPGHEKEHTCHGYTWCLLWVQDTCS